MDAAMSDLVLTHHTSTTGRRCAHLQLGVEATIAQAQELREALLSALCESEEVEIALQGVESADVTCLQNLCAAHRASVAQGIGVRLSGLEQGPWPQLLKESGFARHEACAHSSARDNCLWC